MIWGFESRQGPTQSPVQGVPGALSLGVNRLGRKVNNSLASGFKVKNAWSYTCVPPLRLHGVVLSYKRTGTTVFTLQDLKTASEMVRQIENSTYILLLFNHVSLHPLKT